MYHLPRSEKSQDLVSDELPLKMMKKEGHLRKAGLRTRKTAEPEKYLPYKHEDPNTVPRTGEAEMGGHLGRAGPSD